MVRGAQDSPPQLEGSPCDYGALVRRSGRARVAGISQGPASGCSVAFPLHQCLEMLCSYPQLAEHRLPPGHHHPTTFSPSRRRKQSPFPRACPPGSGDLQFGCTEPQSCSLPLPPHGGTTRAGHQGWSTNATDFISDHLAACSWKAGNRVGPALATVPSNGTWQSAQHPRRT